MRFNFPAVIALFGCVAMVPTLTGQTNTQIFSSVDVRTSLSSAGFGSPIDNGTPDLFNTTTVNLTCPSPVTATLSGPSSPGKPGGNLLVDNNILMIVTPSGGSAGAAVNICTGGVASGEGYGLYNQNCFNGNYEGPAGAGQLDGQDSDSLASTGGVAPIDISSQLVPGVQQMVQIQLADEGGWLAGSTIFLSTNCTDNGVTGPAQVNGNPIPPDDPDAPQLTQDFDFNTNSNANVGFTYDLKGAANDPNGNLDVTPGTVPSVTDQPLAPADFNLKYSPFTSFSTSECLIHFGELDANGNPACKIYTLKCVIGNDPNAAGANCPVSILPNEAIIDSFDGPDFFLDEIHTPRDGTFQEGFGMLMASDDWAGVGGACVFDAASNLNQPCPQNLLNSFVGPGLTSGTGNTTHPNSTFISLGEVPEPRTRVRILRRGDRDDDDDDRDDCGQAHWITSSSAKVKFHIRSPYLYDLRGRMRGAGEYVAQPIKGITYGLSPVDQVPNPVTEPIASDTTLLNGSCPVPTSADPGDPSVKQPPFAPPGITLNFPGDGKYALHFYAQDCAGTQELSFTKVKGSWTTNFRTIEFDVDTTAPSIAGLTLSPAAASYSRGQKVTASFECADDTSGSGVVECGNRHYSEGSTYDTGIRTQIVDTSKPGMNTFRVQVADAAGNQSSASVTYMVK
jgi:hypothetical protein